MILSSKATRFVIKALEHYQEFHDQQLKQKGLSEDEVSDLVNDRDYLDVIKQDFEKYHDELVEQHDNVIADT